MMSQELDIDFRKPVGYIECDWKEFANLLEAVTLAAREGSVLLVVPDESYIRNMQYYFCTCGLEETGWLDELVQRDSKCRLDVRVFDQCVGKGSRLSAFFAFGFTPGSEEWKTLLMASRDCTNLRVFQVPK